MTNYNGVKLIHHLHLSLFLDANLLDSLKANHKHHCYHYSINHSLPLSLSHYSLRYLGSLNYIIHLNHHPTIPSSNSLSIQTSITLVASPITIMISLFSIQ